MNLAEKVIALISETVKSPLKTSYILKRGNERIVLHPGGDYSGIDLSELDLSGLDLRNINLQDVNLKRANLSRANLTGAHLEKADLSGANLSGTVLSGASLKGATIDLLSLRKAIDAAEFSIDDIDTFKTGG